MTVKAKLLTSDQSVVLSKVMLNVVFPCTMINIFQQQISSSLMNAFLYTGIVALAVNILMIVLGGLGGRIFHLSVEEKTSVIYSNSGNMIIPIVSYMFGDKWLIFSAPFLAIQMVFMFTHGRAAYHRGGTSLKNILGNIVVISIIIGFLLMVFHIQLPDLITDTLGDMQTMLGPLSMIITGMLSAGMGLKKIFINKRIYLTMILRLFVLPLILLILMIYCIPGGLVTGQNNLNLIVLLAAMTPSASTIVQFALLYDGDEYYASAINIFTTLCSIVSMPVLVALYEMMIH